MVLFLIKMKYQQLTKEQFAELHKEFATFLATQQIDVNEWAKIKKEQPYIAEEELNIFSDLVWEKVLTKTKYIEHISHKYINVFKCNSKEMIRICVQTTSPNKNFLNTKDFNWFLQHPLSNEIDYFTATKKYTKSRNADLFELIQMGGVISNGELFTKISRFIL